MIYFGKTDFTKKAFFLYLYKLKWSTYFTLLWLISICLNCKERFCFTPTSLNLHLSPSLQGYHWLQSIGDQVVSPDACISNLQASMEREKRSEIRSHCTQQTSTGMYHLHWPYQSGAHWGPALWGPSDWLQHALSLISVLQASLYRHGNLLLINNAAAMGHPLWLEQTCWQGINAYRHKTTNIQHNKCFQFPVLMFNSI